MTQHIKTLHCLRAPLGGILRHVADLVRGQADIGMKVGIVCDSTDANARTAALFEQLAPSCALGIHRFPMSRRLGFGDYAAARRVGRIAKACGADVLHGHGAKGGAYARISARKSGPRAFYTPHGGSLHYDPASLAGRIYFTLERLMERNTSGIIFESQYGLETYAAKIGQPHCPVRMIHNGISPDEFAPCPPQPDAADFLYIGELRQLKGVDLYLTALAALNAKRPVSGHIVGSGTDEQALRALSGQLGLEDVVRFHGPMPIREALCLARFSVMPSRAESFPYVVLETLAAAKPLITTRVGGIGEMFGPQAGLLVPPDDAGALTAAMAAMLEDGRSAQANADQLAAYLKDRFGIRDMVAAVADFYRSALAEASAK